MSWFDRVKMYYDKGLWSKERVYNVVGKLLRQKNTKRLQESRISHKDNKATD